MIVICRWSNASLHNALVHVAGASRTMRTNADPFTKIELEPGAKG